MSIVRVSVIPTNSCADAWMDSEIPLPEDAETRIVRMSVVSAEIEMRTLNARRLMFGRMRIAMRWLRRLAAPNLG